MIKCTVFVEFFVKDSVSKAIKSKICDACKSMKSGDSKYFFSKGNLIVRFGKDVDWDELKEFNDAVEDAYFGNIEAAYYRVSVFSQSTTKDGTSMLYIGSNQCINPAAQSNVYSFKSDTLYTKEYFSDWDDKKVLSGSKSIVGVNIGVCSKCGQIEPSFVKMHGFVASFDFEKKEFIISNLSIPDMTISEDNIDSNCESIERVVLSTMSKSFLPGIKYISSSIDKSFKQTIPRFLEGVFKRNSIIQDDEFVLEVVNEKLELCRRNIKFDYSLYGSNEISDIVSKPSNGEPVIQVSKKPVMVVRKRKVESPKVERSLISANRGTSSYYFDVSKKVLNRQDMLIAGLGYMKETRPNFFNEVIEFWDNIDPDFFFDIETKTVEWEDSQNDISMETVSGETDIEVRQKIHALIEE